MPGPDRESIARFLRERGLAVDPAPERLQGGLRSSTWGFDTQAGPRVLRVSSEREGYEKDRFCAERFGSPVLPIPLVLEIGRYDDSHCYAISIRASGRALHLAPSREPAAFEPLLDAMLAVHTADLHGTTGEGTFDATGHGAFESWSDTLLALDAHDWDGLAERSFLEPELHRALRAELRRLASSAPPLRGLVHGDFTFDNVIADQGRVTAVLDWSEAKFGDWAFDAAWLGWRVPGLGERIRTRWRDAGLEVHDLEARLRTGAVYIALVNLWFSSQLGRRDQYEGTAAFARGELLS